MSGFDEPAFVKIQFGDDQFFLSRVGQRILLGDPGREAAG